MTWRLAIDFGTSNTAAALDANGVVRPVSLSDGGITMPSAVVLTPSGFRVGDEAINAQLRHPDGFERTPKALIGRGDVVLGGKIVSPEDLITEVYSSVRETALRRQNNEPPREVWLTHPVAWAPSQIEALRKGAIAAGFNADTIHTVSEPIAAAAHYARNQHAAPGSRVAVFDFGGGTLDLAVLERAPQSPVGYRVLAYGGDPVLGGRTFDARLLDWTLDTLRSRGHQELADRLHQPRTMAELRAQSSLGRAVTAAKTELSTRPDADISVSLGEEDAVVTITRGEYERLIAGDIERAAKLLQDVFDRVSGEKPALVYLTGGSSRTPAISRMIRERTSLQIATLDDPKLVTAEGALYVNAAGSGGQGRPPQAAGRPPQRPAPRPGGPGPSGPRPNGPNGPRPNGARPGGLARQQGPNGQGPRSHGPGHGGPTNGGPARQQGPNGPRPSNGPRPGSPNNGPRPSNGPRPNNGPRPSNGPRPGGPGPNGPRPNGPRPGGGGPRSGAPSGRPPAPRRPGGTPPQPPKPAVKKRNIPLIIALVIIGIAAVIGLVWGGVALFNSTNSSSRSDGSAPTGDVDCWDGSRAETGKNCPELTGEAGLKWIVPVEDGTCSSSSFEAKSSLECTWYDEPYASLHLLEFDSADTAVAYGETSYGSSGSEWDLDGKSSGTAWEGDFDHGSGGYSYYYVYKDLPYGIFVRFDNDSSGDHGSIDDIQDRFSPRSYRKVAAAVAVTDRV